MAETTTATLPRDVRVDTIGFGSEVQKQLIDGLKTKVKIAMLEGEKERVAGDAFEGLLVQSRAGSIDPAKFLKLYEKGQITKAQYLACVTVQNKPAAECLSGADIDKISTFRDISPSLRVTPVKGLKVELVDALSRLNEAVRGPIPGGGRMSS